jgi:uncharacterized protein (DUF488 family)
MTVYTVGHSTRGIEDLIGLLRANGVKAIADVRRFPRSRRHPQFNDQALAQSLAAGILYRHFPALGGRREPCPDGKSPHKLWREEGFRNYADYADTPAFAAAFRELRGFARKQPAAILCAEAQWRECHRRIIADYLLAAGETVEHILAEGKTEPGALTPEARVLPGGSVLYAAPDLFNRDNGFGDGKA